MQRLLLLFVLFVMFSPAVICEVKAAQGPTSNTVILYWDANSETDLVGYYIYRSMISGSQYIRIGTIGIMAQPSFTTPVLSNGTWYFVVTAYNTAGTESGYSNEVSKVIAVAPAPPKGLRLTILAVLAWIWNHLTLRA